jgi:hypothetical protein
MCKGGGECEFKVGASKDRSRIDGYPDADAYRARAELGCIFVPLWGEGRL